MHTSTYISKLFEAYRARHWRYNFCGPWPRSQRKVSVDATPWNTANGPEYALASTYEQPGIIQKLPKSQ